VTDRTTQAIATATTDLDWFKIPHTIDQVLGIYAESLGEGRPLSKRTLTNDECLRAIAARVGGRTGGHADPTPQQALAGEPDAIDDADGTVGAIDACLTQMHHAAQELADLVADASGTAAWRPSTLGPARQDRIAVISSLLARLAPNLATAIEHTDRPGELDELARYAIAESAAWLRTKGEEIWRASRGDHRPVVVQRAIVECRHCAAWRSGTIARVRGLCEQCSKFQGHHQCLPVEAVVRRWEYGKGATPAQVLESKAASKARRKAAG
jgi:hypothetical protein